MVYYDLLGPVTLSLRDAASELVGALMDHEFRKGISLWHVGCVFVAEGLEHIDTFQEVELLRRWHDMVHGSHKGNVCLGLICCRGFLKLREHFNGREKGSYDVHLECGLQVLSH